MDVQGEERMVDAESHDQFLLGGTLGLSWGILENENEEAFRSLEPENVKLDSLAWLFEFLAWCHWRTIADLNNFMF